MLNLKNYDMSANVLVNGLVRNSYPTQAIYSRVSAVMHLTNCELIVDYDTIGYLTKVDTERLRALNVRITYV